MREDREFKEFRDLMSRPDSFEEGFNWRTVLMAVFIGLVLAPANVYLQLVAGQALGGAAQWVTVILFVEIARRAFLRVKSPEILVLFYMCGAVVSSGGIGLLHNQFFVQSEEVRKMGLAEHLPSWFAPSDAAVLAKRSFFMQAWLVPLALMVFNSLMGRINQFGLGYVLFRLTSDVEKLPFPMAPVGAMGITALADASERRDTDRWRVFSIGAMAGIAFGLVYITIPAVTGAMFTLPLRIIPMPFVDLTGYTEKFLPAQPFLFSFDLGALITGMVIPFWAACGAIIGFVLNLIANPLLYHFGILGKWQPKIGAIRTMQSNQMDFYMSWGIGISCAIALVSFIQVFRSLRKRREELGNVGNSSIQWRKLLETPKGRGDWPVWISLLIYVVFTASYIALSYWLINYASGPLHGSKFPLWLLIFYGFVYTPIISYVSSRMEGIVGQAVGIPMVREVTFILSGYKGAAIWFAPIPLGDYAGQVVGFRQTELTGTKFRTLIKAEMLIFPIAIISTLVFGQLIWSLGRVPGPMFPYADQMWELNAYNQSLWYSATLPGEAANPFREAIKPEYIGAGFGVGLGVFAALSYFGAPIFLVYSVVGSLGQSAGIGVIPMFIGALLGRYVFRKRFGDKWPQYRTVFAAGFGAGVGLISMLGLGIVFLAKSAIKLPM